MSDRTAAASRSDGAGAALAGAKVLVTGASTGIGRAIARAAADAGADVAITYRGEERQARSAASEIEGVGRSAHIFRLDLADAASIADLAVDAQRALGRIDVWINNAGADILTGRAASLPDTKKLDLLLSVDLRGTILASWEAVRVMREQAAGGVILNMSWDHVLVGMSGRNPEMFSAVKGGVMAFSKSLARTVAPRIRVNVLAPGWIDTEFGGGLDAVRRRKIARSIPLARWGSPADVARAAVFLASPDSAYLTGQTLLIGGGAVM
ncbi:MAG TPA: SDR family oxidoreductase [Gemmatimonadaceae bacterium]|nr:SDR family oxidoreductase [Gemmatimonadaceae bacterium]